MSHRSAHVSGHLADSTSTVTDRTILGREVHGGYFRVAILYLQLVCVSTSGYQLSIRILVQSQGPVFAQIAFDLVHYTNELSTTDNDEPGGLTVVGNAVLADDANA